MGLGWIVLYDRFANKMNKKEVGSKWSEMVKKGKKGPKLGGNGPKVDKNGQKQPTVVKKKRSIMAKICQMVRVKVRVRAKKKNSEFGLYQYFTIQGGVV